MLAGPIILAAVIVLVLPVLFMLSGAVVAVIYSFLLPESADATHEGSELIELNT